MALSQADEERLLAMSSPSTHMEHLGSRWKDVREILNKDFFKCDDKIQLD